MESSVDRVPDYLAPIAGARAWKLAPSIWARMGGLLWSAAMINVWEDGKPHIAACDMGHPAPSPDCSCGVYAWVNPDAMKKSGYMPRDHEFIAGVVAGRGDYILGIDRPYWVAEEVAVLAFFDDGYPSPKIQIQGDVYLPTKEDCAKVYDVPIIKYSDYDDFCEYYGLVRLD